MTRLKYFVNAALSSFLLCVSFAGVAQCPFDIDLSGSVSATNDGLLLSRMARSLRDAPLTQGSGTGQDSASIVAEVGRNVARLDIDLSGGGFSPTDATIISRWLLGFRGTRLVEGISFPGNAQRRDWQAITDYILGGCVVPDVEAKRRAARLLTQATFGPTLVEINRAAAMTPAAWIEEQFTRPSIETHWSYVARRGPPGCSNAGNVGCTLQDGSLNAAMESFWLQAALGQDQLRQRVVQALHEIFVVSAVNSGISVNGRAHAGYMDMLASNAFGNFRTLLEEVSLHPSMGIYLSHLRNDKEDLASGRQPDENYAREIMQLFSIGLWELNEDGSRRKDAQNRDIPTYGQTETRGMAKVFTGWSYGGNNGAESEWNFPNVQPFNMLMEPYAAHHSSAAKPIVRGVTIPANTNARESLRIALDTLFNHPNVGSFIGKQLIQRLVTSNPSPEYVRDVARVFANNGSNVRGDMKAVIRAILLHDEARNPVHVTNPNYGKLREPMMRLSHWLRAFNARNSTNAQWFPFWNLEDNVTSIGQNPMKAPSVFNWFRPDYAPPGEILAAGLLAPEFQIAHETTVTGYTNFITRAVSDGLPSNNTRNVSASYETELALANNADALLDHLSLLLMSAQLSNDTRTLVRDAVNAIATGENNALNRRVWTAVALIMASPDYQIQK